ncbi:MAG: methylmalonyl-CoA mutase family protein [Ignavibacteriales bacterium]|nr:methylmalonyl-CoA mutase family protein [Ignavibacteriales bacterium]
MYDRKQLDELKKSLEQWEETSLQQGARIICLNARTEFITTSSEPINRLYTPLDVADLDYAADLGLPGEYPFTRGVHPTLHRGKLWTMRMFAGFGTAEETNAALQIPAGAGPDRPVRSPSTCRR